MTVFCILTQTANTSWQCYKIASLRQPMASYSNNIISVRLDSSTSGWGHRHVPPSVVHHLLHTCRVFRKDLACCLLTPQDAGHGAPQWGTSH
jgi:hypothetical protein